MTLLAILVKACGIALFMGSLLGAYAWSALPEPQRSRVLGQAKWLVIPGYLGFALWVAVLTGGILVAGCDPVFGGFARTPTVARVGSSELLSCRETPQQARVRPELRERYPGLPVHWSHVYERYDQAIGAVPDTSRVWLYSMEENDILHPRRERLEFREVPPKRGIPWWRPQEAADSW